MLSYRALSSVLGPLVRVWERSRHNLWPDELYHRAGGTPQLISKQNPGTTLWLHGASVGESAGAISVARALALCPPNPIKAILFTVSSLSAARLLKKTIPALQHELPGILLASQRIPIDSPIAVRKFLNIVQPAAGVMIESDVWPMMVHEASARGVPLALLDGRISERSARRWRAYAPSLANSTFSKFGVVYAQTEADAIRLKHLGARVSLVMPSLKFASCAALSNFNTLSGTLQEAFKNRPTWIAASTHQGEENIILSAHRRIMAQIGLHDALLILVPRHPARAANMLRSVGTFGARHENQVVLRSQSWDSVPESTSVYIVDTLGELHAFYGQAQVAFVGNSLCPNGRGHNFLEAARAGLPVIMGPHTGQFELMKAIVERKLASRHGVKCGTAIQEVTCGVKLADCVALVLANREESQKVGRALFTVVNELGNDAVDHSKRAIAKLTALGNISSAPL